MSFEIVCTDTFEKELKNLVKDHPTFTYDYKLLLERLNENPDMGTPLGNMFFKTKLAYRTTGRLKYDRPDVSVYFCIKGNSVYLITTHNRLATGNFPEKELQHHINKIK